MEFPTPSPATVFSSLFISTLTLDFSVKEKSPAKYDHVCSAHVQLQPRPDACERPSIPFRCFLPTHYLE